MFGFHRLLSSTSVSDNTELTTSLLADVAESLPVRKRDAREHVAHNEQKSDDIGTLLELFTLLAGWNGAEKWQM